MSVTPPVIIKCGTAGALPSSFATIASMFGLGSTITGVVVGGISALHIAALAGPGGIAIWWGVGQASLVLVYAWYMAINLSANPGVGSFACVAGTVNEVDPGDTALFSMHHDRVDLVVRMQDWAAVAQGTPSFIWCAGCDNCPPWPSSLPESENPSDSLSCSPIMRCYYRSNRVASAAVGTAVGATAGVVVGAIVGGNIGGALSSATSCLLAGIFSWVCYLAVLLVALIVIFAVTIGGLLGGAVGNTVGAAVAPNDTNPTGQGAGGVNVPITKGTYMSAFGNLLSVADANGANALWFVGWTPADNQTTVVDLTQLTGDGTALHGPSLAMPPGPPFCWPDPTNEFLGNDPCPEIKETVIRLLKGLGHTV